MGRKKREGQGDPDRVVAEVFGYPSHLVQQVQLYNQVPSCFNEEVRVARYRVTVERIDEDADVAFARLVELWETCDNFHHWEPLRAAAARIGREFTTRAGCRRARRPQGEGA